MDAIRLTGTIPGIGSVAPSPAPSTEQAASPFADVLAGALHDATALEKQAQTAVKGLMDGSGVEIHEAMIATQKADMAFELALQVRNKAVAAYQQMMQMQF
ncbi:flagellar hook-basal body complex protein FliE [Terriglobus albidus]|uniref:flagellar hook-basal body complex protein FliE n=1 Tax=Terriglobus albidus TaxID=1592106 RepID=UPI0021E06057|nr:flagellar hook-basal body complex protein FliE [Terriglobus albidus]